VNSIARRGYSDRLKIEYLQKVLKRWLLTTVENGNAGRLNLMALGC